MTSSNRGSAAIKVDYGGSNLNFNNNVLVNSAGGITYRIGHVGAFNISDYNDLYSTGDTLLYYGGEYYPTIDSFFAVTGYEQNSISADPCFYSAANLHVRSEMLDNAGSFVEEVTRDYDGDYRNHPSCDIGADEFFYLPNDAPVAVDDSVTTYEDSTVNINILANDYDINGDSLKITDWSNPGHGIVELLAGSLLFQYTPNSSYTGSDSFTYVITDGRGCYDDTATVYITIDFLSDVTAHATDLLPESYSISQNYPNPFNPVTVINFSLPRTSNVEINVLNILGQKIISLVDGQYQAGEYSVTWDGTNKEGNQVASGIYFYIIKAKEYSETKKMILLK